MRVVNESAFQRSRFGNFTDTAFFITKNIPAMPIYCQSSISITAAALTSWPPKMGWRRDGNLSIRQTSNVDIDSGSARQ